MSNPLFDLLRRGFCQALVIGGQRYQRRNVSDIGRNDKCPCRSGKKYKKCCGRSV